MRVLFFGTSDFAVPSLDALVGSERHQVLAVVTQPDRPKGRGLQMTFSPVKQVALRHGLSVLQPRRVRAESFLAQARDLRPDALALAAFGQIIPQALLDLPPRGPINVHGSLLPKYRGAAPIQHALLNGEQETGITTMWMDATLDTGDILLKRAIPVEEDETTGTLTPRLAALGAELLIETLDRLEAGDCPRIPQDHALATHAPAITAADSVVRWDEPASRIRNRIRALSPRPGAFTSLRGRRIKLWRAHAEEGDSDDPGVVRAIGRDSIEVGTGQGVLTLLEVQPENSRRMTAGEWARGARLAVGDHLEEVQRPIGE